MSKELINAIERRVEKGEVEQVFPKAPSPWPPRVWLYIHAINYPSVYFQPRSATACTVKPVGVVEKDHPEYLSVSEHTHLLAEAVREAKAQVWDEAGKVLTGHIDTGVPSYRAAEWFKEKASELRKGATPENGEKA